MFPHNSCGITCKIKSSFCRHFFGENIFTWNVFTLPTVAASFRMHLHFAQSSLWKKNVTKWSWCVQRTLCGYCVSFCIAHRTFLSSIVGRLKLGPAFRLFCNRTQIEMKRTAAEQARTGAEIVTGLLENWGAPGWPGAPSRGGEVIRAKRENFLGYVETERL